MSNEKNKIGHDPKNREVKLSSQRSGLKTTYNVVKEDTGYNSGKISSYEDAVEIFNHQVNCSQNQ